MNSALKYNSINDNFMRRFPELELLFQEQLKWWEGSELPAHCFLGNVLNDYVSALLRENTNKQQIEKIFFFYEELAASDDSETRNLLQVTLLEYLWGEDLVRKNALEYMQPKTRAINSKIMFYLRK